MPRYSKPSAYPRSIEVLGEHGLDLVAVMQRTAGVGHDDFADVEALQDFRTGVGHEPNPAVPGLDGVAFDRPAGGMGGCGWGKWKPRNGVWNGTWGGQHADLQR